MKEKYGNPVHHKGTPDDLPGGDWQYYIDWGIAWLPMYCQGTLIWLCRYWTTWPELNGKPILAEDVLPEQMNGSKEEMYRVYFPYDPRKKK